MTPSQLFATAYRLEADATGASERIVADWVHAATAADVVRMAADARTAFRHGFWARYVPLDRPIADERFAAIARSAKSEVAGLLTLHRSGWVRELGLAWAVSAPDAFLVPFLLLRTDDIVARLSAIATEAVVARLHPADATAFARSLGIVALLRGRVRGGRAAVSERVEALLCDVRCRDALTGACLDGDANVRREAFRLRLSVEPTAHVLRAALGDPDTRIRWWAARTAISRATTDEEKRSLLEDVVATGSPWARVLALRTRDRLGDPDSALEPALLDPRAAVRYAARALLRRRRPDTAFGATRTLALAKLGDAGATARELLGALGALADVGVSEDARLVAPLAADRRASVRAEADRTLRELGR